VVASAGVQVPPLLLLTTQTSKVDLGARLVEVNSLLRLPVLRHRHHLCFLLCLDIVQRTERHHQETGLIVSLRQVSLGLLILLKVWALVCLMAYLPTAPARIVVDLLL